MRPAARFKRLDAFFTRNSRTLRCQILRNGNASWRNGYGLVHVRSLIASFHSRGMPLISLNPSRISRFAFQAAGESLLVAPEFMPASSKTMLEISVVYSRNFPLCYSPPQIEVVVFIGVFLPFLPICIRAAKKSDGPLIAKRDVPTLRCYMQRFLHYRSDGESSAAGSSG